MESVSHHAWLELGPKRLAFLLYVVVYSILYVFISTRHTVWHGIRFAFCAG